MKLETLIESARILLTDKNNTEYVRGICELLAAAFPVEAMEPEERAKEIEALIFSTPLERAITIINQCRSLLDTIVNDGVNRDGESDILSIIDIENGRELLARTKNFQEDLKI